MNGGKRPGGKKAGAAFSVRNQSGAKLAIEFHAGADSTELDGLLRVRLSAAGRTLADTTLQAMRQRPVGIELASGGLARMRVAVWLPADVLAGYEGRMVHVTLVPQVRAVGARG